MYEGTKENMAESAYGGSFPLGVSNQTATGAKQSERDRGEVTVEYGNLAQSLGALRDTIEQLGSVLGPVLSPSLPTQAPEVKNGVSRSISPLADSLRSEVERVQRFDQQMQEMISRIEL